MEQEDLSLQTIMYTAIDTYSWLKLFTLHTTKLVQSQMRNDYCHRSLLT